MKPEIFKQKPVEFTNTIVTFKNSNEPGVHKQPRETLHITLNADSTVKSVRGHQKWTERFLKWIKQHLKIKGFLGTSEIAVRIWVDSALIAYCIVAIVGTNLKIERSTYEILQVLKILLLDNTPAKKLFTHVNYNNIKEPF